MSPSVAHVAPPAGTAPDTGGARKRKAHGDEEFADDEVMVDGGALAGASAGASARASGSESSEKSLDDDEGSEGDEGDEPAAEVAGTHTNAVAPPAKAAKAGGKKQKAAAKAEAAKAKAAEKEAKAEAAKAKAAEREAKAKAKAEAAAERATAKAEAAAERATTKATASAASFGDLSSGFSGYTKEAQSAVAEVSKEWKETNNTKLNIGGETVNLLIALLSVPDAHVEAGHFMAHFCANQFRFGADHTRQPENAKCLYEYDGARYNPVTNADPLNEMSQTVTKMAAKALRSKLRKRLEVVQKKLDPADDVEEGEGEDGEVDPEKLGAEETLLRTLLMPRMEMMIRKLSTAPYLNAVQPRMRSVMYNDAFYTSLGKVGTKVFCDKLDAAQHLLGCNNGVFDLHHEGWEKGASFMFHPRGDGGARLVSMSTQYDFTGNPDGTPKTPEQAEIVKKLRITIFDKIFFEPGMNKAVRLVIGCCFFGNITAKKLFFLLGAPNGGKSLIIFVMKVVFGDYFGAISPMQLTEKKNERDPDAPQPVWAQSWKKRVIVFNEGNKSRVLDREQVCEKTGGDPFTMRGLHGKPFEETLLAALWWIANHAPKYDGGDGGMVDRPYAVSADAMFLDDLAAEDPVKGIFKKANLSELKELVKRNPDCALMMFLGFAREFADGEKDPSSGEYIRKPYTLPAQPESKARTMVQESGAGGGFARFARDHLKSTLKVVNGFKTGSVDWDAWGKEAAKTTDDIMADYYDAKGGSVKKDEVIAVLEGLGHTLKKRSSEKHGWNKKGWDVRFVEAAEDKEDDEDEGGGSGGSGSGSGGGAGDDSGGGAGRGDEDERRLVAMAEVATEKLGQ